MVTVSITSVLSVFMNDLKPRETKLKTMSLQHFLWLMNNLVTAATEGSTSRKCGCNWLIRTKFVYVGDGNLFETNISTLENKSEISPHTNNWIVLELRFFFVCEVIGTAATPGLLCQPRVIVKMIVEKQMECTLARETEVLGENLPQRHFCSSQNPIWPDARLNPGRRAGKPATNSLSYGETLELS
jgi:hypothetical protein